MVVAETLGGLLPFFLSLYDTLVAPALAGVGLSPAPLRETLVNVMPVVTGGFVGSDFEVFVI